MVWQENLSGLNLFLFLGAGMTTYPVVTVIDNLLCAVLYATGKMNNESFASYFDDSVEGSGCESDRCVHRGKKHRQYSSPSWTLKKPNLYYLVK